MTKKHVCKQSTLAIRPREVQDDIVGGGGGTELNSKDTNAAFTMSAQGYHNEAAQPMAQFRAGHDQHIYVGTTLITSPPEQSATEYAEPENGDEDNLLAAFMSGQVAENGDLFDDAYYYVQDDFFARPRLVPSSQQDGPGFSFQWGPQQYQPLAGSQISMAGPAQIPYLAPSGYAQFPSDDAPTSSQRGSGTAQRLYRNIRSKGDVQQQHAPPDTFHVEEVGIVKGRKRALSPEGRLAAQRVRSMRACGRCHALKARCQTERPCKPCKSRHKRSLDFPCMPELPRDRWTHLFTEELYGHLDLKSGGVMEKMPRPLPDASNKPFTLRLHQYFDDPELTIPVIRFVPKHEGEVLKSVFPIEAKGNTFEVSPEEICSPPLVPALNGQNFPSWTERFRWTIRRWLDCAEFYDDLNWHSTFFRPEHGKAWPRAVFGLVCRYFHDVEWSGCEALKSALQSTVFAYLLGHSFYVPHDEIQEVLDRSGMKTDYDGSFQFVSPIHVDRFIKAMLYPFFRVSVFRSLKGLQALCAPNKHSKYGRDQVLATSLVLLIVAGSQQSKAVEKAVALERRGEQMDWDATRSQILEIEEWIIDLVLQLWEYKFPEDIKWARDEPQDRSPAFRAKLFKLHKQFQQSYHEHEEYLNTIQCEIPNEINRRTFGATNIDRVLKKFYACCFANNPEPSPTDAAPKSETVHNHFWFP